VPGEIIVVDLGGDHEVHGHAWVLCPDVPVQLDQSVSVSVLMEFCVVRIRWFRERACLVGRQLRADERHRPIVSEMPESLYYHAASQPEQFHLKLLVIHKLVGGQCLEWQESGGFSIQGSLCREKPGVCLQPMARRELWRRRALPGGNCGGLQCFLGAEGFSELCLS